MPAIAPALRTGRCVTAAASTIVVDAGALVDDAVGDAVEDEELELVPPGGLDSSGKSYSSVSLIQFCINMRQVIPGLAAT